MSLAANGGGSPYNAPNPPDVFDTANEIHIPVGVPVLVRLHGADVIHSFWVPQLSGKTDAIPGQTNLSWIQADRPGRYLGQCTEFCGYQHAKMQFEVVAEPQAGLRPMAFRSALGSQCTRDAARIEVGWSWSSIAAGCATGFAAHRRAPSARRISRI